MNLRFYESGPLCLDASGWSGEPEVEAFANVLRDEIEKRRVELGGVYGGKHRISHAAALLLGESNPMPKNVDYLNARKWFEFLTDLCVIRNVERRTGITIPQFLSTCIDKLCPPNWETLFWMRAAFEVGISEEQLRVQLDLRKEVAGRQARTEMATKAARERHREHHAMKAEVFEWLDVNMIAYNSMDSAAEAIAKSVAPIKFRTARTWVGQWKKLRSAGRLYTLPDDRIHGAT